MEKIKELMTEDPVIAELPGNRREVVQLMVKNELTGMPVVKGDELKGFVTRQDFFNNPDEDQLAMVYKSDYPSLGQEDSIRDAAELFVGYDINYIPITKDGGKCTGILTTADMMEYVEEMDIDIPVGDVASSPCFPVYEDTPIKVAMQAMRMTKSYAFPVVDGEGMLRGIITDRDLFNLSKINGELVVSELGLEQDEDSWSWKGLKNIMKLYYEESKIELPDIPVKEAMVDEPMTVYNRTEVSEAARLMRRNDYGQLPIVDERDALETMVYELDLVSTIL